MRTAGFITRYLAQIWKHHFRSFGSGCECLSRVNASPVIGSKDGSRMMGLRTAVTRMRPSTV
jgi:hypothetical protein